MEQKKIDRINELARKKKEGSLSAEEQAEQKQLREEYILEFRAGMRGILDNTYIEYPDGNRVKVSEKKQK